MQYIENSDGGAPVPTPASVLYVGLPLVAQLFEVPLVPALNAAPATLAVRSLMRPTNSSSAWVVSGAAPLDGDVEVPEAAAVLSSGAAASPVTANARARPKGSTASCPGDRE